MPLDLADLTPNLLREVTPPGGDLYPTATEDELVGYLQDGFWEARIDGLLNGWTELDGSISPDPPNTTEIPREFQQLIVIYGGVKVLRTALLNAQTTFRANAGTVGYETQLSAQVLVNLLRELQDRRQRILIRLADLGTLPFFSYIDGVAAREFSLLNGGIFWVA